MKESELLHLVMDWLAAQHVFALRMNTGAMQMEKRLIRFGIPGMADILSFPRAIHRSIKINPDNLHSEPYDFPHIVPTWIECKVGRNGQSDLQKSFQREVMLQGHRYILCYSLECLEAHFL